MRLAFAALLGLSLTLPSSGEAATVLALDTRPNVPGIQSTLTVGVGTTFAVDLVLAELDPGESLQGFQVELALGGGVLTPLDVLDGGFLNFPVAELRRVIDSASVLFVEVSLGTGATDAPGVLARFLLEASALGSGELELPVALLSGPFGEAIAIDEVRGAVVTVPEPAVLLFATLCSVLLPIRRRRS